MSVRKEEERDPVQKRKLIEVALPLEAINREAAREKSIRHGHPSTLHLWWARRPLAAARAVLFAQLVDDPSSHPDRFPTEEAQATERRRLHELIERLVVWENLRDEELLAEAHEEILHSTDGSPPPILDPFAGGGTIPLEAQRLGLRAQASDLNPVAVLINKALIEIPPMFAGRPPVFPGLAETELAGWNGAAGLAADVRAYGKWMRVEAEKRIGQNFPKATLPNGNTATVIAWIWARTVTCPNPACGVETPLVRSWWLCKREGKEAYVIPKLVSDSDHPSGRRVQYKVGHNPVSAPSKDDDGSISGRRGATCVSCGSLASMDYIRMEALAGRMGRSMMSVVCKDENTRVYFPPVTEQLEKAEVIAPADSIEGEIGQNPRYLSPPAYGLPLFADLFTGRQLLALTTFSDLVLEVRDRVLQDTLTKGSQAGKSLEAGGSDAEAYADAIATYLGMVVSTIADDLSTLVTWRSSHGTGASRSTFARQALPMTWDYAELNPFAGSAGDIQTTSLAVASTLLHLGTSETPATVEQKDAVDQVTSQGVMSTDPPYYDNIGYADLSDYFYVWLRRSLRKIHPSILGTMLVPKTEELVANPYRHDGKSGAKEFFEVGFRKIFARARNYANGDYPITVYYAFKQTDIGDDGEASTGWETLLDGMIRSGWAITATWPMRSERGGRMVSIGTNALASSIVLALRPRPEEAPTTDRRGLIAALQGELPRALRELQQGRIAPVDLPQAAIGPGMAVFSRYSSVIEADGSPMSVRSALSRINEILDQVLNEQEGDFDPTTRFALSWYRQHGYGIGQFGDANNLANARNTSVEAMARSGILTSAASKVRLLAPEVLEDGYDAAADDQVSAWEVLHHMIASIGREGIVAAAGILSSAEGRDDDSVDGDLVKELVFLLFSVAEKSGWTKDAMAFNDLATSWPDIVEAARDGATGQVQQASLDL